MVERPGVAQLDEGTLPANMLAEGRPFGACYYDNAEGKRVFSLRSKDEGADVSEIAVAYGGGGHARASGFTALRGWEGDGGEAVHEGKLRDEQ
jgi:hypothetical protein